MKNYCPKCRAFLWTTEATEKCLDCDAPLERAPQIIHTLRHDEPSWWGGPPPEYIEDHKPLSVPKSRPTKWSVGDMAIEYITLRPDDDPMPPCVMLMVVGVVGDMCQLESLEMNYSKSLPASQLKGVAEALEYYDNASEEMTVRSARIGRRKLESLAEPFAPFPEWVKSMEWWDAHPEDRPDGYPVLCEILRHNATAQLPPRSGSNSKQDASGG